MCLNNRQWQIILPYAKSTKSIQISLLIHRALVKWFEKEEELGLETCSRAHRQCPDTFPMLSIFGFATVIRTRNHLTPSPVHYKLNCPLKGLTSP